MPASSRRFSSHPLWRSLQLAFGAVLVGIVIFVGLTRTQVGRDNIRQQVETAFNQRFEGTLSIDSLNGPLITDFIATDVEIRSPSGALVATIDSLRGTPRWANLLTAELSLQSLTLFGPNLSAHRNAAGTWNVARAFQQTPSASRSARSLDLTFSAVEVHDGRITTTRSGSPPEAIQKEWLFDYTRTQMTGVSFNASVQQSGTNGVVQFSNGSFALPAPDLQASSLRGQIRRTDSGWSMQTFDLSLDTTRLRGRASLQTSARDRERNTFSLALDRSRIDHDELRRLVPRLPLADVVTIEGELEGNPERLTAQDLTVTHNTSFATVDGTFSFAPEDVSVNARLTESRLTPEDVREVWPELPSLSPPDETGPFHVDGTLIGTVGRSAGSERTFDLDSQFEAHSPQGAVQGSLAVAQPRTSPATYAASLDADSLNLAPFTETSELATHLNGHVEAEGIGLELGSLQGTLDLSLSSSHIAGRPLASADAQVTVMDDSTRGRLIVRQPGGGQLSLKGSAERLQSRPSYTAAVTTSNLDLNRLAERLPSTALNAHLTLNASGTEWRPLNGTTVIKVDSSRVYRGDSTVALPPHSATVRLTERDTDRPRLSVTGSVLTLTASGTTLGPSLWSTTRIWSLALQDAVRRARNKPAPTLSGPSIPFSLPPELHTGPAPAQEERRASLPQMPSPGPLNAQAKMRVHSPEVLHAWWAGFPEQADEFDTEVSLTVGTDSLHSSGQVTASHLQSGTKTIKNLEATYELSGRFGAPLAQSTQIKADVSADRIAPGGPPLQNVDASLSYASRSGNLTVTADSMGIADSLRLRSTVRITPNTNELVVREVSANVNGREWTNPSPSVVRAYSNALVITPFVLREPHPQTPSLQQIRVGGTLSSRTSDTLTVEAENVFLPPFSEVTGLPHLLGGNLDARFDLRGGWGQPKLDGNLAVHRLSYDRRILGDASFHTQYSAQSPDLSIEGSLNADIHSLDRLTGPDLVPEGARTVDPNSISVEGHLRLPAWARMGTTERASTLPPGESLDLSMQVNRADLFFFRYIFEERVSSVEGHVSGPLHIGGQFRDPTFDANLSIENGAVRLPLFGLEYDVNGPVDVDRKGIHPRNLRVRDEEGTARIDGSILFNEYQYFSFDLSASLDGITVIDVSQAEDLPFYGSIRGTGPLTLTGPLSDATLQSDAAQTTPDSELFIPVSRRTIEEDTGFIVFADSTGQAPDVSGLTRRSNILADRPEGVPTFVEGLNLDLNVTAPNESTVNLVFDPIVGDVVTVVGSGRVQLQRQEGDFSVYGNFNATSGSYLFTAGEVFVRRFSINQGTITWDGSPTNAKLDLDAEYQTRASPSGLPGYENYRGRIPVTVQLAITGRVATPQVDLSLSLARSEERNLIGSESLDAILNQPARTTEFATSVLLTNTFLLTTGSITQEEGTNAGDGGSGLTTAGNQLAFNSVSQLVSSQLNRYLGEALPNVDLNFGVQGEDPNNLDLIYGVALRLLNERLVIRGEGVYTSDDPDAQRAEGPQGEFVAEVRLSPSVSAKIFYRRTGDELTQNRSLTSSRGAGVSYQTHFSTWRTLFDSLFGWMLPTSPSPDDGPESDPVAQQNPTPSDSSSSQDSGPTRSTDEQKPI